MVKKWFRFWFGQSLDQNQRNAEPPPTQNGASAGQGAPSQKNWALLVFHIFPQLGLMAINAPGAF